MLLVQLDALIKVALLCNASFLFCLSAAEKKRNMRAEHLVDQKEFKYLKQTLIMVWPLQVYCVTFFTDYRRKSAFSITLERGGEKKEEKSVDARTNLHIEATSHPRQHPKGLACLPIR